MKELAKQYDPSQVEDRIYQFWQDGGYFHTEADPDKKPYTIVMPPPNVTGQLHMGHALDNTMQDVLIRTKRMQGYAALWVPGTDHASIATEAKVVEAMRAEGLTKEMVGRDGFLERAWDWKTKYGNRIVSQLKKLGSSCDWERERFTMDEDYAQAVRKVFCDWYHDGLLYRGKRFYYLPETFVFDEKIQNTDDFSRQRRRWLSAQWHYCQTFAKFLWKALAARNWDFCDKLFQQLSIPRLLLMGFTFFFSVLFTIYRWTWGLKWWLLLVLLAVALLVAVPKRFCTSRLAMALQKIPYTFLLMAGNIFKLRGANKSFIHTKHGVVEK